MIPNVVALLTLTAKFPFNLSAKELKIIAEEMWLVKWEDFQANASAKDMLELIEKQAWNIANKEFDKVDVTIENEDLNENKSKTPIVVTPVKRNGKIYKKGDKIDYFDWMEKLINDWIIKLID